MLILHHTVTFAYLLANFRELLKNIPRHHSISHNPDHTIRELSRKLRSCAPHIIAGELKQLYLTSVNREHFFHLIQTDTDHIRKHIETIDSYISGHPVSQNTHIQATCLLIKECATALWETLTQLKALTNPHSASPGTIQTDKPHFNRQEKIGEPHKLRHLLIQHGFIPETTSELTILYIFYGSGYTSNWQPITWLKSVSELSYFIEMFFGITDQNTKWKIAHACFRNIGQRKFNYNSLRGKQYNYRSGKHSAILQTIDHIRHTLK
ncbi:hypothetical protein LJB85_04360 [Porphyromonadaceae bacterium OttesenSCG-928-L07]|nr:hypothetical protein [Porphyromonadaceae bacterium OttesenSCG-928-L07]